MSNLQAFIDGLPKAELHLHLEGSLEPEMMFEFARRNAIELPFSSVEEIRQAYCFNNLQEFLDVYYAGMSVLQTEQDFYDLTTAYLIKAKADNVRHVEVFFDPQAHTARGIDFSVVVTGIARALNDAKAKRGITSKLIMCFLRHLSEADAFAALEEAESYLHWIYAVGLDSSEVGHPPEKFQKVFSRAGELGLKRVAHAGEEGPPAYVLQALDLLHIDRLDHGNRAMEDPALIERLRTNAIALTVCPLSNLKLGVISQMENHPIRSMLDKGLLATINSDDPSYFGGYVNDNYHALVKGIDLNQKEITLLAKNSFIGSFLSEEEKNLYLQEINEYIALN